MGGESSSLQFSTYICHHVSFFLLHYFKGKFVKLTILQGQIRGGVNSPQRSLNLVVRKCKKCIRELMFLNIVPFYCEGMEGGR